MQLNRSQRARPAGVAWLDALFALALFGVGLFKSTDSEHKVMVEEDFLEERVMYGNVTIKVIKFRKGQMITIDEARAHGLLKE